jgi:hypothetical protein
LRPADAAALVACFRRCYGDTYSSEDFYDADKLARRIESGSLRSVVAIADDGALVGHTGLTARHPNARAIEAGNTVVDPAHRGGGLLARLAAALTDLCVTDGFVGYVHYPTTAHEIMQKASVRGGGVETGVMLDYIPDDTDYRAIERRSGRLAATVVYQPIASAAPRTVLVPRAYRERIAQVYMMAGLPRTLIDADAAAARLAPNACDRPEARTAPADDPLAARASDAVATLHARRDLLHVHVARSGADLVSRIDLDGARIAHVDVRLNDRSLGAAVAQLRSVGFVYCALLPEFADTDVLRLQRFARIDGTTFGPALANPDAQRLLALIRDEYSTAQSPRGPQTSANARDIPP